MGTLSEFKMRPNDMFRDAAENYPEWVPEPPMWLAPWDNAVPYHTISKSSDSDSPSSDITNGVVSLYPPS